MRSASIDTNIIGHLYRSNTQHLIYNVFDEVFVDEFIMIELNRRCKDIYTQFHSELHDSSSPFKLIDKDHLRENALLPLYNLQLDDLRYLFMPRDEGEKRACALAQTKGSFYLLTDDEKQMDGPYYMIDRGLIRDMESLAFWDLIFLNVVTGKISCEEAFGNFNAICNDGYIPDGYKGTFQSKMNHSIRRLKEKEWFKENTANSTIKRALIVELINYIKRMNSH